LASKTEIAEQAKRDVLAAADAACESRSWETIGVSVDTWWPQTFLHYRQGLAAKVHATILTAQQTEDGCLELGKDNEPKRIAWRGHRQKVYQLIAWAVAGDIPRHGLVVRHKCDNRLCINPDHLEVGTQSANLIDQRRTNARRRSWPHGG
jgi:hypothetical protein